MQGAGILRPPPKRSVDEWADAKRELPADAAEPGPWRSSRVPYMIGFMRACTMPRFTKVVIAVAAQMSKTECMFNAIGRKLDDDPAPVLYIGPTQKQVKSISEDRIIKMFRSTPSLWAKMEKGKRNRITEKYVSGVRFGFGWAGSATELSSHPAGLVVVDERDRMSNDVEGEGDPVTLAEARISTYPDGKVIVASTPTVEGASPIWDLLEEGTLFKWAWTCPSCNELFVPMFRHLWWPKKATASVAEREAKMVCPHCETQIGNEIKTILNERGYYIGHTVNEENGEHDPTDLILDKYLNVLRGEMPDNSTASFWASGLCSPWRTFGQRAKLFLDSVRSNDPGKIQAAINTGFGEPFKVKGEAPPWEDVAVLRRDYEQFELPQGSQVITAGVDVQKDRIYYVVRSWGYNSESWLLDHGELFGETDHDPVWLDLATILARQYQGRPIRRMFVDSGFRPGSTEKGWRRPENQIYKFCRQYMAIAFPSKGRDVLEVPIKSSRIDVTVSGKRIKQGLQLWHIDTDHYKTWVHARVRWPVGQPGGFHLFRGTSEDYCRQVVAEKLVLKPSGHRVWVRDGKKPNHYLDCEVLAAAAGTSLQVYLLPRTPLPTPRKATPPTPEGSGRKERDSFIGNHGDWFDRR